MAPSILIADPDGHHADGLKSRLSEAGFAVTHLTDADAALARVRAEPPELVILSDELGDASGFSLCNRIRRVPGLGSLPVFILVTPGNAGAAEAHRASRSPASEYLERPVEPYRLFEAVLQFFPDTQLPDRTLVAPLPAGLTPPPMPAARPPPLKREGRATPPPEALQNAVLAELRDAVNRRDELEAELAEARKEVARERERADAADVTLEALTRDLQNAAAALAEQQQVAAERQKAFERKAGELDELARTLEEVRAEAKELRAALLQAEAEGAEAKSRVAEVDQRAEEAALRRAELEALVEEVQKERDALREAQTELARERDEARALADRVAPLEAEVAELQRALADAETLRERVALLEVELEEQRRTVDARDSELAALAQELERSKSDSAELAELRAHLAEEEHQRTELTRRCERLEEDLQVQAALTDDWRVRCEELEVKLAGAEKAAEVVRGQTEAFAAAQVDWQRECEAARRERDEAVAALEQLRSQGGGTDDVEELRRENAVLRKKLTKAEEAREAAARLKMKLTRLEKALAQARGAKQSAR